MKWPDLSRYEGEFQEGKMHGKGKRYYANGNIYDGNFCEDKAHGQGRFYKAADNIWKQGTWNMGKTEKVVRENKYKK